MTGIVTSFADVWIEMSTSTKEGSSYAVTSFADVWIEISSDGWIP